MYPERGVDQYQRMGEMGLFHPECRLAVDDILD